MGPFVEIHHVPKAVSGQTAKVGDDRHEHASHALFIERARQMMVIDEIVAIQTKDRRHHMGGEELGQQVRRRLFFPGVPLLVNLVHADRDLGRP
jgi:hypothetical protein